MGTCKGMSLCVLGLVLVIFAEVDKGNSQLAIPAFRVPQCSKGGEFPRNIDIRSTEHPSGDKNARMRNRKERSTEETSRPQVFLPSLNVTLIGAGLKLGNRTVSYYSYIKYGVADRFKHSVLAGRYWGAAAELEVGYTGDDCAQTSLGGFFTGSEDCLFLDIYVPKVDCNKNSCSELLPVMFFIHGGSFTLGGAYLYFPKPLLTKDVIVVVIQYRLGTLGWLSLQNDDMPGNAGLSDQITALKWVQENIAAFGGDSNKVTIIGHSAGAASVTLLQTIGPVTKGLFSGVIGHSGSALEFWAFDKKPLESAWKFATEFCKCPAATNSSEIYDCLSALPVETIALCTHDMVSSNRMNGMSGIDGCAPVVQGNNVSEKYRLITKMPEEYITAGEAVDVPLIMGATRDEGSFILAFMYLNYLLPKNLFNNSNYLASDFVTDAMSIYEFQDSLEAVQERYFTGVNMTSWEAVSPAMIDFLGVSFVKAGTYKTAMLQSSYYNSSTFFYSFDYESNSSMFSNYFLGRSELPPLDAGVTHGDDLMYFFSFSLDFTAQQRLTSERMVTLWTNFAKYGNPTPIEEDNFGALGLPQWPELEPLEPKYLLIQDDFTVAVNYTVRWTIRRYLQSLQDKSSNMSVVAADRSEFNSSDIASTLPVDFQFLNESSPATETYSTTAAIEDSSVYTTERCITITPTKPPPGICRIITPTKPPPGSCRIITPTKPSHGTSPFSMKTTSAATVSMTVNEEVSDVTQTEAAPPAVMKTAVVAAGDKATLRLETATEFAMETAVVAAVGEAAIKNVALGMETDAVAAMENAELEMENAVPGMETSRPATKTTAYATVNPLDHA